MKEILNLSRCRIILMLVIFVINLGSCDSSDDPQTIPIVITSNEVSVAATTATGGGEVTADGNSRIVAGGLCWSSLNGIPTVFDDTTKLSISTGSFMSLMKDLMPSTTYHVRAYATNGIGTGYGEVITFTTGNAPPEVTDIAIEGAVQVAEELTASYDYIDAENDSQGASTFQWYLAEDATGLGEQPIEGATELSYTIRTLDEFKFIRFGVKPVATSGSMVGLEVKSSFVGPVAEEPTIITFTYNNESVTYGIVISAVTGRRWMDRNLGASNSPSAYNDFANEGDLFQWGRLADGHQLAVRTPDGSGSGSISFVNSPASTTLSTSDVPTENKFILGADPFYDWRDPRNSNLWHGPDNINNPCPVGWHIPSRDEWIAEQLSSTDRVANYSQLKLTITGNRSAVTGSFRNANTGYYWSSTVNNESTSYKLISSDGLLDVVPENRAQGAACKCIKNVLD